MTPLTDRTLEGLRRAMEANPGDVELRQQLGLALIEAGFADEGASQLRLAAQLDGANAPLALTACAALVEVGRERDAALLLSSQIQPQRRWTRAEPQLVQVVTLLLGHPEPFVRCHAVRGVGRLRLHQGVELLVRCCADPDGAVRLAAQMVRQRLLAH